MDFAKPIPQYPDYTISRDGVVTRIVASYRKNGSLVVPAGATLKHYIRSGYPCVRLYANGISKNKFIHHLLVNAFIGDSTGMNINHIDGNKLNYSLDNLEICTASYNSLHSAAMQRHKGKSNAKSKITHEQAIELVKLRAAGAKLTELSSRFGLCVSAVSHICTGRNLGPITQEFRKSSKAA